VITLCPKREGRRWASLGYDEWTSYNKCVCTARCIGEELPGRKFHLCYSPPSKHAPSSQRPPRPGPGLGVFLCAAHKRRRAARAGVRGVWSEKDAPGCAAHRASARRRQVTAHAHAGGAGHARAGGRRRRPSTTRPQGAPPTSLHLVVGKHFSAEEPEGGVGRRSLPHAGRPLPSRCGEGTLSSLALSAPRLELHRPRCGPGATRRCRLPPCLTCKGFTFSARTGEEPDEIEERFVQDGIFASSGCWPGYYSCCCTWLP
jgi:hypothetical protein